MVELTEITIRCSTLSGYPDCPRRAATSMFWRQITAAGYILKDSIPGIAAHIGTAVHEGARFMLGFKARTGLLPPLIQAVESSIDTLEAKTIAQGAAYDDETKHLDEARHQVRRMTAAYMPVARTIDPIMVEERLEATVSPGIILSGQADSVARQPHAIRDLKTGKNRPNMKPQAGGYSLIARSHGLPIERLFEDYIPRAPIRKPQQPAQTFEHDLGRCESAAVNVMRHVVDDLRAFTHGDPSRHLVAGDPWAFLANPHSNLCGPKYCRAWGTDFCHEHRDR